MFLELVYFPIYILSLYIYDDLLKIGLSFLIALQIKRKKCNNKNIEKNDHRADWTLNFRLRIDYANHYTMTRCKNESILTNIYF